MAWDELKQCRPGPARALWGLVGEKYEPETPSSQREMVIRRYGFGTDWGMKSGRECRLLQHGLDAVLARPFHLRQMGTSRYQARYFKLFIMFNGGKSL
jgi:hypothetical protein